MFHRNSNVWEGGMVSISGGYTAYSADECRGLEKLLLKLEQESLIMKAETSPHLRRMLEMRIDDVARRLDILAAISPAGRKSVKRPSLEDASAQRAH
jgi:hypothetical protein